MQPTRRQLLQMHFIEALRFARLWLAVIGIFALGLATLALTNSVGNPETWTSAFRAFAAAGFLVPYAGWFAGIGALLLLLSGVARVLMREESAGEP
jgi:hypothetical protein